MSYSSVKRTTLHFEPVFHRILVQIAGIEICVADTPIATRGRRVPSRTTAVWKKRSWLVTRMSQLVVTFTAKIQRGIVSLVLLSVNLFVIRYHDISAVAFLWERNFDLKSYIIIYLLLFIIL